ncbi:MAG TPA: hypothetical protein PLU47_15850 [Azonexus sp.]|nr:hypothetical protein [Azonexus sp.]
MLNVIDYYEYSKLAAAAYTKLSALDGRAIAVAANGQERLPEALAIQTFVSSADNNSNPWTVPTGGYHGNDASGFAATLFQRGAEKVLAIRGTEPNSIFDAYTDLLKADLQELGEYGMAISQTVSLYNYIQCLMAPSAKSDVVQLQIHTGLIAPTPAERSGDYVTAPGVPPKFIWVTKTYTGQGLGELIKYGDNLTLTGHSLGGHLAAIGARLFPTLFTHGAVTFNAPGYDPLVGISNLFPNVPMPTSGKQLTDEFINTLFAPYLEETPASSFAGRVITIESEDAIPGDDFDGVSGNGTGTSFGPEKYITTEKVSHDIGHLMDGLAIQALMIRMNNALDASQTGQIVEAASASSGESYEILLDKLTRAITGQTVTVQRTEPSSSTDGGTIEARRDYYTKFVDLEKKVKANPNLHFESLLGKSPEAVVNLARFGDIDALAYRYALKELNPFAVLGADYGLHNQNGELNLAKDGGEITEQYLADRAQFLTGDLEANTDDTGTGKALRTDVFTTDLAWFEDEASGLSLQESNPLGVGSTTTRYTFGDSNNDTLNGADAADHLYGGAGSDTLTGGAGDDYLEGNAGNDSLTGGRGSDTLIGGAGLDTYTVNDGDGWDTLEDSDGQGAVYYGGVPLSGGDAVGDSGLVWQKKDGNGQVQFTYILTDWTENGQTTKRLSIQGPDGGVFIRDWRPDKNLGITLPGAPTTAPPTVTTLVGGASASYLNDWGSYSNFTAPNQSGPIQYPTMQAGAGNAYIDGNYASTVKGGAGNAWIVGRAPDNALSTGPQTLQGGQGDTFISTGSAEGTFIGGAGNTLIDARYYRSFQSDYAWNAIGSAFKLNLGWQASSTYRMHTAYDLGYFDPGQTPDTGGLDWLGYVDTAELSDGDQIYVAQPGFGTAAITGQDDTGRSYRFDPVNWTLAIDGGTPTAQYEWVAPILAPKKQTLIGGQRDNVLLANDAGNILVGGGGLNVLIGGKGDDRITAGNKNSVKRICNDPQWSLAA